MKKYLIMLIIATLQSAFADVEFRCLQTDKEDSYVMRAIKSADGYEYQYREGCENFNAYGFDYLCFKGNIEEVCDVIDQLTDPDSDIADCRTSNPNSVKFTHIEYGGMGTRYSKKTVHECR